MFQSFKKVPAVAQAACSPGSSSSLGTAVKMVQVLHRNSEPWFSHTLTLGSRPLMFLTFSHQKLLLWFSLWNHWVSAASTVSESSGLLTSVILVPVGLLGRIHGKSESHRDQKRNQITHSSSFCIWLSQRLLLQGILWALTLFWPKAEQDQSLPLTPLCWNVRAAVSCRTDLPRLPPACGAPLSPPSLQGTDTFRIW